MGIKRSTFYYQVKENKVKVYQEAFLKDRIHNIAYQHPYYGYRRMTAQLQRENININHKRVLRLMRQLGIQARIKRRYVVTTNSKHHNQIYTNLIKDKIVTGINQIWYSDITYIRILTGFVYLAAILDIYSHRMNFPHFYRIERLDIAHQMTDTPLMGSYREYFLLCPGLTWVNPCLCYSKSAPL